MSSLLWLGLVTGRGHDQNQWAKLIKGYFCTGYFWPRSIQLHKNKKKGIFYWFWPKKQSYGHLCTCIRVLTSPRHLIQFSSLKRCKSGCFRLAYKFVFWIVCQTNGWAGTLGIFHIQVLLIIKVTEESKKYYYFFFYILLEKSCSFKKKKNNIFKQEFDSFPKSCKQDFLSCPKL